MNIISNYSEALRLLKSSGDVTAERTNLQMDPFDKGDITKFPLLRDFHSSWLMYIDGEKHKRLRSFTMDAIKSADIPCPRACFAILTQAIEVGCITDKTICDMANTWHQSYLGLTPKQQGDVLNLSKPLLDFFFFDEVPAEGLTALESDIYTLENWFRNENFALGGLLNNMKEHKLPIGTCLNVIIDSYEPLKISIGSVVFASFKEEITSDAEASVQEILRLSPPFRYINRVTADSQQSKVTVDLYQVNRDNSKFEEADSFCPYRKEKKHMSFGQGKHYCPGSKASVIFLTAIWTFIQNCKKRNEPSSVAADFESDKGFCRYKNIKIEWMK